MVRPPAEIARADLPSVAKIREKERSERDPAGSADQQPSF
jgi:hypothetical protein